MNRSLFRRAAAGAVLGCAVLATVAVVPSVAHAAPAAKPGTVYLAGGQSIHGRALHKPACTGKFDCSLSGDSTAFLYRMRWSQWSTTKAVGTGTYLLNSCTPNCAAGTFYKVPVVVTFSNPVKACVHKSVRWYWTKASFRYPHGLPPALRHDPPLNPWNFTGLAQDAKASCR